MQLGVESNKADDVVSYITASISCGDTLEVSKSVIVVSCFAYNKILILKRSGLNVVYTKTFPSDGVYGEQLRVISFYNGLQTYVFYGIRKITRQQVNYLGLIEIF